MRTITDAYVPILPALVLLAGSLVLTSCDLAAAGNTAILNAASSIPPTVEYTFEYTPDDVTGGRIEVVSEGMDDLGSILTRNGFSRSDVVSARVDSVSIERLSAQTFEYLTGADIYLGTSTSGPQIGAGQFSTDQESATLNVPTSTVTSIVKQGRTNAFASLDPNNPNNVPDVDRVEATVYFQIEVEGV